MGRRGNFKLSAESGLSGDKRTNDPMGGGVHCGRRGRLCDIFREKAGGAGLLKKQAESGILNPGSRLWEKGRAKPERGDEAAEKERG